LLEFFRSLEREGVNDLGDGADIGVIGLGLVHGEGELANDLGIELVNGGDVGQEGLDESPGVDTGGLEDDAGVGGIAPEFEEPAVAAGVLSDGDGLGVERSAVGVDEEGDEFILADIETEGIHGCILS
jgi:hypothetical protein